MELPIRLTGQGIRDLNDRGPKKKPPAPPEVVAAPAAAEETAAVVPAPSTDDAPAPEVVPNG